MLKQNIQQFVDTNYKGSLRFLKDNMFIKKFGIDAYQTVMDNSTFLEDGYPFSVKVYNLLNDVTSRPSCKTCKANTKFNSNNGWPVYCSNNCRYADSDTVTAKRQQTNIEKYGATNVLASAYGLDKSKQTHLQKYGVTHYNKTDEYANRIKTGDIVRNIDYKKVSTTHRTNFYNKIVTRFPHLTPLFTLDEYIAHGASTYHHYNWQCNTCDHKFEWWINMGYDIDCPICKPPGTEHENDIMKFLYDHNIEFRYRDRKMLGNGQELDFYIPSKNIAIEINGLYFHHSGRVPADYHLAKTELASKQGIRLIHIFGDELINKTKIVYNRLKSILGIITHKVYARKCVVQEIDNDTKNKFLNEYHIQGTGNSSVNLGLYHNNTIVAVMSFCKQRAGIGALEDGTYELMRYATISDVTVVGGAGKLLKYFKQKYVPVKVISYADRRWSEGNVYKQLGFTLAATSKQNYWYTKTFTQRFHRLAFQVSQLAAKMPNYDAQKSESENMTAAGFYRVYDCGTYRFDLL